MLDTTKIIKDIQSLKEDQYLVFRSINPSALRSRIRKRLTILGIGGNIVLSVSKDRKQLIAYHKQIPYVQKLENLVREMMLGIDDEQLYDKAMKLLEVKYG